MHKTLIYFLFCTSAESRKLARRKAAERLACERRRAETVNVQKRCAQNVMRQVCSTGFAFVACNILDVETHSFFFFFLCMFFLVGNGNAAPASFALGLLDRISEQLPRNENQMRCAMALLLHF